MVPAQRHLLVPPFLTEVQGDVLAVVVLKDVDLGTLRPDWPQPIIARHPGPFRTIAIDLRQRTALNSAFYAGLIQLHHVYAGRGATILLDQADAQVVRDLRSMRLDGLFSIAARPVAPSARRSGGTGESSATRRARLDAAADRSDLPGTAER